MKTERNIYSGIRRLALMLFSVVGLLLASACSEDGMEGFEGAAPKEGYITINLSNTSMRTRDTESDDKYNENRIQRANIYLFKATAGDDDTPVLTHSIAPNAVESTSVQIKLNRDIIADLFPEGSQNKALAYVVANLPAAYSFPEVITLGSLRTLPITSDFATATQQTSFIMNGEGTLTLSYDTANPSKSSVEGEVHLQRAASKITLAVSLTDEVTDGNGVTWRPVTASMNVLINNGVDKSKVNPTYESDDIGYFSTSTANNTQIGFTNSGNADDEFPWNVNLPLYTYPNKWSEENQEDMTFLTLNVQWTNGSVYRNCYYMVPVVKDSQLVRNTSYRVMINVGILGNYTPEEPLELTDVSYRAVDWGAAPVDVDIADYRYLVVDRDTYVVNNENSYNISFYSSHEVVVTNVTMTYYAYNTNANGIERAITVTQAVNNASAARNDGNGLYKCEVVEDPDTEKNKVDAVTGTRILQLDHQLLQWTPYSSNGNQVVLGPTNGNYPAEDAMTQSINSIAYYTPTNDAAYSIYEFEVTIAHKDNPSYTETIKITQYPALYISTEANNYVMGTDGRPQASAAYGSVYINGLTRTQTSVSTAQLNNLIPSGLRGTNRNPNMYVIGIVQLSNNDYIIGDPRVNDIDNPAWIRTEDVADNNRVITSWTTAPALYDGPTRTLKYYYPTDGSESTKNMVAPKYRIASSYAVSSYMNMETAIVRCAGYQEKNYPAGRWRLPTYGELEYILTLSNTNKIPELFNSASVRYCTAQGFVHITNGIIDGLDSSSGTTGNVRCVYDEWYWGDSTVEADGTVSWNFTQSTSTGSTGATGQTYTTAKYPFTWGDAPR
ncbi:MAG: hypothetical protein K2M83_03695 [Muribaculaceae bacterium]|nr:hypothetical protein [Muribaculaceae bacterium]